MIKTILTGFILGLILILAVPATLIMASWNAVPGDSNYKIKVGLEKTILGVAPSNNLKTTLEIKYTERRFSEVEKIINNSANNQDKYLNESLTNLTNQAIASKNSLQKIQNIEEKTIQKENLIATLESISSKIEEKKQISDTAPNKVPTNTPTIIKPNIISQPTITNKPSSTFTPIPTSTPIPTKNNQPIISPPNLEDTKDAIDEIIDELKDEDSTQSTSNDQTEKNNSKKQKDNSSKEDNQNKYQDDKEKQDRRH